MLAITATWPSGVGLGLGLKYLLRVTDREDLAGAAIRPIKAVSLCEAAHQLHRLARAAGALSGQLRQLVDAEERGAVGALGADHVGAEDGRCVAVRVLHLRYEADRLRLHLPLHLVVSLASRGSDEPRIVLDVGPDGTRGMHMLRSLDPGDPRVASAGTVITRARDGGWPCALGWLAAAQFRLPLPAGQQRKWCRPTRRLRQRGLTRAASPSESALCGESSGLAANRGPRLQQGASEPPAKAKCTYEPLLSTTPFTTYMPTRDYMRTVQYSSTLQGVLIHLRRA
eukprot:scaffold121295_cov59-Phaeocystis_antarctica.AAC.4